ncbi:hypothetical protein CHU98_g7852 [Xylaria longipes]|nr:hypothetical protein CHU98_g7852 [Xylaria longipes]
MIARADDRGASWRYCRKRQQEPRKGTERIQEMILVKRTFANPDIRSIFYAARKPDEDRTRAQQHTSERGEIGWQRANKGSEDEAILKTSTDRTALHPRRRDDGVVVCEHRKKRQDGRMEGQDTAISAEGCGPA